MTFKAIKQKIAEKLFPEYVAEAKRLQELYRRAREGLSVVDLVREQLRAFDPNLINTVGKDALDMREGNDEKLDFLAKAHELAMSKELQDVCDTLIRDQVYKTVTEADNMAVVNFGRATINGIKLLQEELERFSTLHKKIHERSEDFDKHEIN